ncbi:MAG TPA: hypothetical protein VLV45_11875 [Gemmatimonadales bacterium]|nr:hypothetical protein [Gemmatimonadales bacterium]
MRGLVMAITFLFATVVPSQGQEPTRPVDTTPPDTGVKLLAPQPPVESPAQARYRQGLKTTGRGVAQLKDGIDHVASAGRDSVRLKQAGQRLAALCGAAQGFLIRGRGQMSPSAYADSTALKARKLNAQIDTLVRAIPSCESAATKQPKETANRLVDVLKAYEAALRDYRSAMGLPNH